MLTNTERQHIVEEVNAGTYGIDKALDDIAAAQKGEEVRKALYAEALVLNREGHAGSTDMIARQQIANLQTSVNGQISTLRSEVGDDIDDLETALNSGLATQNGKIAAQDATIANVVANYNVEYGSTELWASTGETGALAAGTTVTLSEDVSHFDYIDIYSFCGNSNVLDTVPVDAKLQSSQGYALRWVNLSDPDSGSYKAYVRIIETRLHIIGTTLNIDHQVTYRNGEEVNISGAEITQSNRSTYIGELGIMKIVGRKITANTEIEDVRIGADGTEYDSAGQAVRAQVNDLKSGGYIRIPVEYTEGGYIADRLPGGAISYSGWKYSDYIDISASDGPIKVLMYDESGNPTTDGDKYNAFYYADKTYAGQLRVTNDTVDIPDGAKYIRLSCRSAYSQTSYIFYRGIIAESNEQKEINSIVSSTLSDKSDEISPVYTEGGYINDHSPGNLKEFSRWKYTDYIDIEDAEKLTVTMVDESGNPTTDGDKYNGFYHSDKSYAGVLRITNGVVDIPDGAKYIRLSCRSAYSQSIIVEYLGLPSRVEKIETLIASKDELPHYLKIGTWNVGIFNDGAHKPSTAEAQAQIIKLKKTVGGIDADLLNTQEYSDAVDSENTISSANLLSFKYPYKVNKAANKSFSKLSIIRTEVITFASGSGRSCIATDVNFGGKVITIVNAHISIEQDASVYRSADIQQLVEYMSSKEYCILTGDFNVAADSEFDPFKTAGFTLCNGGDFGWFDTWPVWSNMWDGFSTTWPCYHLDNIIVTSNIVPQYVEAVESDISDHAPLVAILLVN